MNNSFVKKLLTAFIALAFVLLYPSLAFADTPEALFVPIDDRPSTYIFPPQIARIAGGTLKTPPRHLLGKLYTPGSKDAIGSWLVSSSADTAIVSADMLCYGGLIASRTSAVSTREAIDSLDALVKFRSHGSELRVFAIIPRLSLRTSDKCAPYEKALLNWASSGNDTPPAHIPEDAVKEYLSVRNRNIEVIKELIKLTREQTISQLTIGQDDSASKGLHIKEQQKLSDYIDEMGVGDKVRIISGADELAMNITCGWLADTYGLKTDIEISCTDPQALEKIPPYENQILSKTIADHLALSGARPSTGHGTLILLTPPSDKPYQVPDLTLENSPEADNLAEKILHAKQMGRSFGIADLSLVNRADPLLAKAIISNTELWDLEAYAAWNTPSNALGTVIAQAAAHQLARKLHPSWTIYQVLESEKTHTAFTFARLIDDYAYQAVIRPTLSEYTKGIPADVNPLLNAYGPAGLQARLAACQWAEDYWQNRLLGKSYPLRYRNMQGEFSEMKLEAILPWPRVFEMEVRLDLRLKANETK